MLESVLERPHLADPAERKWRVMQEANPRIARDGCFDEARRSILASTVHNENLANDRTLGDQPLETWADAAGFVQRRDDDAYVTSRSDIDARRDGWKPPTPGPQSHK
jgi:hypothetical protein